jgi:hypothetical protein
MRTAKRLAHALLVRFAGMVCPAGAVSAAGYCLGRFGGLPLRSWCVIESVGFPGPSGSGFAAIDGCRSGGRLPGGGVDRAPSRTLAETGNLHLAVLERSALATGI